MQLYPGGTDAALDSARIASDGTFRLTGKASRSGALVVRLQGDGVVAAAATGSARPASAEGKVVYVAARLSAATRHLDVLAGRRAVVRGAVRPALGGRRVVLQARVRGHYRTIARDPPTRRAATSCAPCAARPGARAFACASSATRTT